MQVEASHVQIDHQKRPHFMIVAVRVAQVVFTALMAVWIFGYLGGLRFSPLQTGEDANDTAALFNWHPLLITIAFVLLMAEAVLAYKAPLIRLETRNDKKLWHFILHSSAALLTIFGTVAALRSHTLKKPSPMANFYSTHSALGLLVIILFALQYIVALTAYIAPKWPLPHRRALGPVHSFLGISTFTIGLATMAVGIQEKTTFIQLVKKPGVYEGVMRIPCFLQLLLVALGMAVLYHHSGNKHNETSGVGDGLGPPLQSVSNNVTTLESQPLFVDQSAS